MSGGKLDRAERMLWRAAEALAEIVNDDDNSANVRRQAARDLGSALRAWLTLRRELGAGDEDLSELLEKLPRKFVRYVEAGLKVGSG